MGSRIASPIAYPILDLKILKKIEVKKGGPTLSPNFENKFQYMMDF